MKINITLRFTDHSEDITVDAREDAIGRVLVALLKNGDSFAAEPDEKSYSVSELLKQKYGAIPAIPVAESASEIAGARGLEAT